MTRVTVYGKPECHLCDEALELLHRIRADIPFALEEVDITTDDALHARYLERIPVVAIDGREAFELVLVEAEVRGALAAKVGR